MNIRNTFGRKIRKAGFDTLCICSNANCFMCSRIIGKKIGGMK